MDNVYKFSPSEFAFGYQGCKRCYYDEKVRNISLKTRFPSVFSKLDKMQKNFYQNQSSKIIDSSLEEGIIITEDADRIQKSKILKDKKGRSFYLSGKLDAYIKHKNSYTIVDFKVTDITPKSIDSYASQLQCYSLLFENPDDKSLKLTPVKGLGIFCFEPNKIEFINKSPLFNMHTKYYEIEKNDEKILKYLTEVIDFLENKTIPPFGERCNICEYKKNLTIN
jgi:hypothetical protein